MKFVLKHILYYKSLLFSITYPNILQKSEFIVIMEKHFKVGEEFLMIKKGALTGLLLFGMFFGAGNLIFPLSLGWNRVLNFGQRLQGLFCLELGLPS